MSVTNDVRGRWKGSYRYSSADDLGDMPFDARLLSKDGVLTGMTVEPHLNETDEIKASIEGIQEGAFIRFEKRYHLDQEEYNRVIYYEGMLGADARTISGTWRHSEDSGTFEMKQQA